MRGIVLQAASRIKTGEPPAAVFYALAVSVLLACPAAFAQAGEQPVRAKVKVLVQRFEAVGVEAAAAAAVEEAVVLEAGKREGVSVVTSAELEQTLGFQKTGAELGCDRTQECMVEVKKKLSADVLLTGKVGRLGAEYVVSLGMLNLDTPGTGTRTTIEAPDLAGLKTLIKTALDKVFGSASDAPAYALGPGETLKLAVMPMAARGVPASTADAMTQILSAELNQVKGVSVIGQDDIKAMLDKVSLDLKAKCEDSVECIVEIGAALGLSKLVTGAVGVLKDTYVISLKLIDTRKAEVKSRVLESFNGDESELKNAIKYAAYKLVGVDLASRRGGVALTFNVKKADVRFGGSETEVTAGRFDREGVPPGRYTLQISPDAKHLPLQTDIYVLPDSDNTKSIALSARPPQWYQTWWFWTIAGVVVAGAAGGIIWAAASGGAPSGGGTVTIGK